MSLAEMIASITYVPYPITASYDLADGTPVYTEPTTIQWKEGGMLLGFRFTHAGKMQHVRRVELSINGDRRMYDMGHDTTLVSGDHWDVVIALPYE